MFFLQENCCLVTRTGRGAGLRKIFMFFKIFSKMICFLITSVVFLNKLWLKCCSTITDEEASWDFEEGKLNYRCKKPWQNFRQTQPLFICSTNIVIIIIWSWGLLAHCMTSRYPFDHNYSTVNWLITIGSSRLEGVVAKSLDTSFAQSTINQTRAAKTPPLPPSSSSSSSSSSSWSWSRW